MDEKQVDEKEIKRLQQLKKSIVGESVQPDELAQVVKVILDLIKEVKSQVDKEINDTKAETSTGIQQVSYTLNELELRVKTLINSSENTSLQQIKELSQRLSDEINRVEQSIPSITDLSPIEIKIENSIKELENKIPKFPEELKAESIRDKLETLEKDERLDASAIKGLGKRENKLTDAIINRAIGIVDQRTSFLLSKVSNLQSQVDAIDTSGSGSGGFGIETPTGTIDGSNATFTVLNTPSFILLNGATYFENDGYTRSGLTITMDSAIVPVTGSTLRSVYGGTNSVSWVLDATPTGTVNGSNLTFTIPSASQAIVYADGVRVKGGGVTYTFSGGTTITFTAGNAPGSSVSIDYLPN